MVAIFHRDFIWTQLTVRGKGLVDSPHSVLTVDPPSLPTSVSPSRLRRSARADQPAQPGTVPPCGHRWARSRLVSSTGRSAPSSDLSHQPVRHAAPEARTPFHMGRPCKIGH